MHYNIIIISNKKIIDHLLALQVAKSNLKKKLLI